MVVHTLVGHERVATTHRKANRDRNRHPLKVRSAREPGCLRCGDKATGAAATFLGLYHPVTRVRAKNPHQPVDERVQILRVIRFRFLNHHSLSFRTAQTPFGSFGQLSKLYDVAVFEQNVLQRDPLFQLLL